MIFVRSGPETIVFTFAKNFDKAEKILLGWSEYACSDIEKRPSPFLEVQQDSDRKDHKGARQKEEVRVHISQRPVYSVCSALCSTSGLAEGIAESRMQPGYILMRLAT